MRRVPMALVLVLACGRAPDPPPPPPTASPDPPPVAAAPGRPPALPDPEPHVRDVVRRLGSRQACNDVNGCDMVAALAALGAPATQAVRKLYDESSGDAFWRTRLVEALGRSGDTSLGPWLARILGADPLSVSRVEAAFAMGRLGLHGEVAGLKALAASADPERDRPVLLAVGYALARLGDPAGKPLITQHLVIPEDGSLRWDRIRPGIVAAGELRMGELRPRLEAAAAKADPFVRREAIRALAKLRDRAAIPALIDRLEDPLPGVRGEALAALRSLTGFRYKETAEQWRRWWNQDTEHSPATGESGIRPP